MLLVATERWDLGVSYDSVVYVQASHHLGSIGLPQPRDHGGSALYWWAPVYPVALKAVGGTYSSARLLNAFLLVVGVLLVGGVAWHAIGALGGVTAGALYAFSPPVFASHLNLLAEPLYLILSVAALALIAARRSTFAGLATAAAILTRYAGLPLIIVGAVLLRGRDRVRFLVTSLAIYVAWLIRNELAAGETTGRQLHWHPPSWSAASDGVRAFVHLFITSGHLPSIRLAGAGLIVQLAATSALVVAVVGSGRERPPRIVTAALGYAIVYCAFLAVTVVLFDAGTPLDERLFVPVVPSIVLTVAWLARARPMIAVVLAGAFALTTLQQARTVSLYGIDYSGKTWSAARIDAASLPAVQLYSNWPAAVAYFTGRSPRRLPARVDPHTLVANPKYAQELAALANNVRHGEAALVVLNDEFLQIAPSGTPITETPAFKSHCRPLTEIVDLCK
jgi:hypothetical protein